MLAKLAKSLADSAFFSRLIEVADRRSENRMTELGMLAQAFEFSKINGILGDYWEFGVWRGKTFKYAHKMAARYGCRDLRFVAFDSFAGLPAVQSGETYEIWQEGQFACSQGEFTDIIKRAGFRDGEFELVPVFYDQSLDATLAAKFRARDAKLRIAYIDCDLYESTKPVLSFIAPFLQDGSVLCFDDYYNYRGLPGFGEQRAITEFLAEHPEVRLLPYHGYAPLGASFIVHRVSV